MDLLGACGAAQRSSEELISKLHTNCWHHPCRLQVARPPKLRVAAYAPSRWEGTPIETLERRLGRARCRLQCAGENFE